MKNKKKIGIVFQDPFPIGMASSNRVLSYAKELAINQNVKIYIPLPTESEEHIINKSASGKINGINFEYINKTTTWPLNYSKISKFFILIKNIFCLLNTLKKDKPEVLIFYSNSKWMSCIITLVYFLFNFIIIIEENEFPKVLNTNLSRLRKNFILYVYRFADGMIVMTNELENYYKSIKVKKVFVLPMTVDFERYSKKKDTFKNKESYFAYVGSNGGFLRDGLLDSVIAFNIFYKKYNKFKFYIIGPINKSNVIFLKLEEYILNNSLENSVLFLGSIASYEIPRYLQNATGLMITPPKNFTSGGFPTKLGEYLASGTPVIITKVSEISNYLSSDNAFLVEPGDTEEIYSKMALIVEKPNLSNTVGENGKMIAESIFGAKNYITKMENFMFNKH